MMGAAMAAVSLGLALLVPGDPRPGNEVATVSRKLPAPAE
jgi:hypothetical protein